MARYKAILAYDGTQFFGFQRQAKERTIQGEFEAGLRKIGWQEKSVLAAGRTDTGVHAIGQVVVFDLEWKHSLIALQEALNTNLPGDIAVRAVDLVHPSFHPRFDATARKYRYQIFCEPVRNPLRERFAWRIWPLLHIRSLDELARQLEGTFDFVAFGTSPVPDGSTIRTIFDANWSCDGSDFFFEITGTAFLYRMVRRIVHFQVEVAHGKQKVTKLSEYLSGGVSGSVQGLAPANGLILTEVIYS